LIFECADKWVGAGATVKRSLSQLNLSRPEFKRLLVAADATRQPYKAPGWLRDVWAHVAFPKQKVAICLKTFTDCEREATMRERWEASKWRCAVVAPSLIMSASDEKLIEDLKALLKVK